MPLALTTPMPVTATRRPFTLPPPDVGVPSRQPFLEMTSS
jgi:hypothetical protein